MLVRNKWANGGGHGGQVGTMVDYKINCQGIVECGSNETGQPDQGPLRSASLISGLMHTHYSMLHKHMEVS